MRPQWIRTSVRCMSDWKVPEKPSYNTKIPPILRSLKYVQAADQYQNQLDQAPKQSKITELMNRLEQKPYLMVVLRDYQEQLKRLGIDQRPEREALVSKWKFYILAIKLKQLHRAFWDQCEYNDISSHKHRFRMDINDVGLLDPRNFSKEDYDKIMSFKE
ncbi:uncharacterized protein KQ657_000325 [Scheffersomyces spartinae]|uniref:Uncharacterized protein n=1 Tax=Scheffersomyces spartinae TaxID=45513 RepID=A0A9P7V940_9ASCO|nr:uncharacterized protein KQ657_000325 [Scheffersomyces spartinae]KAG7193642.1 hypothetical protein KQ657_000325 [Scheffersomyces spartinae]